MLIASMANGIRLQLIAVNHYRHGHRVKQDVRLCTKCPNHLARFASEVGTGDLLKLL
jgi:hypothetical protein